VFCCLTSCFKINAATFAGWMRILSAVPGSVLWLLTDNRTAENNLRVEAERCSVRGERLIFAGKLALAEHLARYRAADLFLDTFPCGAHTTASDALWCGLPLLTRPGASFVSRVAASLLKAVNLPELIAASQSDYEALAIALATDPPRLAAIKGRLASGRATFPLFDTALTTRHLEAAYREIYERYQAGIAPVDLQIKAGSDP
jgi:protein O-GlcNAc transferase